MKTYLLQHLTQQMIFLLLIICFLFATTIYFFVQYKSATTLNQDDEISQIVTKISKLIELPIGEPKLATVTDKSNLSEQDFFKKAEDGDKVLIYVNAGKAYLYRPSINKIIEFASLGANQLSDTNTLQPSEQNDLTRNSPSEQIPITMEIYNGSTKVGITSAITEQLEKVYTWISVTKKDTAFKNNYDRTLVIDPQGKHETQAKLIAEELDAVISSLPQGESTSSADILIIVGNDYIEH